MTGDHVVYLGVGTNLGDRAANLQRAASALAPQVTLLRASSMFETRPWGPIIQPNYLNQVFETRTGLPPQELLVHLKNLEVHLGRQPGVRYGPRLIDLDILFYDGLLLDLPDLTIPHAHLTERAFVLVPLAELSPGLIDPRSGKTIADLLREIGQEGVNLWKAVPPLIFGARTYVMGILNMTPDSFSGDGLLAKEAGLSAALEQAHRFVAAGADILDIGGESTRPGSKPVSGEEEVARVLPLVKALVAEKLGCLISVDTSKAAVAEATLAEGADWINDVWGLRADPDLAGLVSRWNAAVVLMHNRSKPNDLDLNDHLGGSYHGGEYQDLLSEVKTELLECVTLARNAGIPDEHILLDPGIGFGKSVEQNLALINHLDEIKALGFPVLLGTSRKSFIGRLLDLPPDQRLEGTSATVAVGILRGADIIRVHDVEAMLRVARITDRLLRA